MPCSCGHLTCLCGIPCSCSVEKCSCKECAKGIGQICILCNGIPLFEQLTLRKSNDVCTCFMTRSIIDDSDLSPLAQPFVARSLPLNLSPGSELQATSTEPQVVYRSDPGLEPYSTEEIHVQNYCSNGIDQTHAPLYEPGEIHVQDYYPNVVAQTHELLNESEEIHLQNYYTDIAHQTYAPLNAFEEIHVQNYYPNITVQTHVPLDEYEEIDAQNYYTDIADQTYAPFNESEEIDAQNYYTDIADQPYAQFNESEEMHAQNYYPNIIDQTHAPLIESEEIHVQNYYPNVVDQMYEQNISGVEDSVDLLQNEPLAGNSEQIQESWGNLSGFMPYDRFALQMKLQEMASIWKKLTVSWLKRNQCPHLSDDLDKLVLTRKNI